MKKPPGQQTVGDEQQARVRSDRMPRERDFLVQSLGGFWGETVRRTCEPHRKTAAAVDRGVVPGVWPVEVAVVLGALVRDDVGVERSGYQDGDTESKRRDLVSKRFAPPFHRSLRGRVGGDCRNAAHATLTRYHD